MSDERRMYKIYDLKAGRYVALLGPDGVVEEVSEGEATVKLRALMQREVVIREGLLDVAAGEVGEVGGEEEPYPEETMCYFGLVTMRPGEAGYVGAFVRRLPYISFYEAHPVEG